MEKELLLLLQEYKKDLAKWKTSNSPFYHHTEPSLESFISWLEFREESKSNPDHIQVDENGIPIF